MASLVLQGENSFVLLALGPAGVCAPAGSQEYHYRFFMEVNGACFSGIPESTSSHPTTALAVVSLIVGSKEHRAL